MKFIFTLIYFVICNNSLFANTRAFSDSFCNTKMLHGTVDTLKNNLLDTVDVTSNYKTFFIDSLQREEGLTAYDVLSRNPNFRLTDGEVYYRDKLLNIIKVNGQVFKFTSPLELLKMFPANILSSFSLSPYTDPLNSFLGNNNKDVNSIDLRTPSGKILGILGSGALKYNFRKKFDFLANTIIFKNNKNFVVDFNLNNNAWDWGAVIDANSNKIMNGSFSVQNNLKFRNGEFNLSFNFNRSQSLTKDYFLNTIMVIDSIDNSVFERIQKSNSNNISFNTSFNKFYEKIYLDVTSGFQYNQSFTSVNNSNELTQEFRSDDSIHSKNYNGSFNLGYKIYKDQLFIVGGAGFGGGQIDGKNKFIKEHTENYVFSNSNSNFFQPKLSLKFNVKKVFFWEIYHNFSNSLSYSSNIINRSKAETLLKNQLTHTGTILKYSKKTFDFNTNVYYEKSSSRFENNVNRSYLDQNSGILNTSSVSKRLLKSKLNLTLSLSKSLVYPSIGQKDPTIVAVTDNYASIGNPNLKNQSLLNLNWNGSYLINNTDNASLSFARSINRNKIVENLFVLQSDTVISGIKFSKGGRLLTFSNSVDDRSPNTTISFLYNKSKFLIDNLSLQHGLSYSANRTERFIATKNYTDVSRGYRGNLSLGYLKDVFSINTNYSFFLNRNEYNSVEGIGEKEVNQTINHNFTTNLRFNYFVLFNIELRNMYDAVRYSSDLFENSRTDLILSQKYLKRKLEFKLNIFDLFNQMKQNKVINNDFLITKKSRTDLIGRYFMLNITYRFQNLSS